jgi:hypothetical protein
MNTFNRINIYVQLIMSALMVAFGILNALRCIASLSLFSAALFIGIAYVGYAFMFRPTIEEMKALKEGGEL